MIEEKQREEAGRFMALRSFARTIGIAEEIAMETYNRELRGLAIDAKVTRFVGIIAERRTREALLDLRRVLLPPAQPRAGIDARIEKPEEASKHAGRRTLVERAEHERT